MSVLVACVLFAACCMAAGMDGGPFDSAALVQMKVASHTNTGDEELLSRVQTQLAQSTKPAAGTLGSSAMFKELALTVLTNVSSHAGASSASHSETCLDIVSSGRSLRFVFRPGSGKASVVGKFSDQDVGWKPSLNSTYNLTVVMRSHKVHTLIVTDQHDPSQVWSKDFYHTGWYPHSAGSPNGVRVLTCKGGKSLAASPHPVACEVGAGVRVCHRRLSGLPEKAAERPYRGRGLCHPNVAVSRCSAGGERRYRAYDSSYFDFKGGGTYTLTFSPADSLKAQIYRCPVTERQGQGGESVAVAVGVQIRNHTVIKVGNTTFVDGVEVRRGQLALAGGVDLDVSQWYLVVKGPSTPAGFGEVRASTRILKHSPTGFGLHIETEVPRAHTPDSSGLCTCSSEADCKEAAPATFVDDSANLFAFTHTETLGHDLLASLGNACCPGKGGCTAPQGYEPEPTAAHLCMECSARSGRSLATAQEECALLGWDSVQHESCLLDYCSCCQADDPEACSARLLAESSRVPDTREEAYAVDTDSCLESGSQPRAPSTADVRGELVHMRTQGNVSLVTVPSEGETSGHELQVDARVEPGGREPTREGMIISRVRIAGSFLQGLPPLVLSPARGRPYPTVPLAWKRFMAQPGAHEGNLTLQVMQATTGGQILLVRVGPVTLELQQQTLGPAPDSFNLVVRGLSGLGNRTGGLLSLDDSPNSGYHETLTDNGLVS